MTAGWRVMVAMVRLAIRVADLGGDGQVTCPYCSRHFAASSPQADDEKADTENSRRRGPKMSDKQQLLLSMGLAIFFGPFTPCRP